MSQISYACVSRGSVVLANYFLVSGDFEKYCLEVRQQMAVEERTKIVERPSARIFITKDSNSDLYFMCAGTPSLDSRLAFDFLDNLQKKFIMQFSRESKTSTSMSLQNQFSNQIREMMEQSNKNKLNIIKANINDAQESMNEALHQALLRGSSLESMSEKADSMALSAADYQRTSNTLLWKMRWQRIKWFCFGILAIIILIILILIAFCGIDFSSCRSKGNEKQ